MITKKETALLNPGNYSNWSRELWADRDCVLAAVHVNGEALAYANIRLRADRNVVLTAVQQKGMTLRYADDDLREDREVVLAAVQQNGFALNYASKELRADREVALAAVQQNGRALVHASEDLQADHEVALAAVRQSGIALKCVAYELRSDREIVLAAVRQSGWALYYADDELRRNEAYISSLADISPLGNVWRFDPEITTVENARKAIRSSSGLAALAKQGRASILGEPLLMKDFLVSAIEKGCITNVIEEASNWKAQEVVDALRTVMVWYGVTLPDILPLTEPEYRWRLCALISSTIVGTGSGTR